MYYLTRAPVPKQLERYKLFLLRSAAPEDQNIVGSGFDLIEERAKDKAIFEFFEKKHSQLTLNITKLAPSDTVVCLDDIVHYNIDEHVSGQSDQIRFQDFININSKKAIKVPVSYKHPNSGQINEIVPLSTKGYAGHRTKKKALESAILELFEQDAFFLSWYGNLAACDITLAVQKLSNSVLDADLLDCKLLVLQLPTIENSCIAVCAVLIRKDGKGFMLGLGSGANRSLATQKALREVAFFYSWNNLFGSKDFVEKYNFSNYRGFVPHLEFFWHQGRHAFMNLLAGDKVEMHDATKDVLETNLQIYSRYCGAAVVQGTCVHVVGAFIPGLIPQHALNERQLDFSAVNKRWPTFKQIWPICGIHPFT